MSWWEPSFRAECWFCFCIASVVFRDRIANWLLKGGIGVRITREVIYNWSGSEVTDEWSFFPKGKEEKGKTAEDWVKRLANFCVAEDCEYWVDETEFSHRTLILSSVQNVLSVGTESSIDSWRGDWHENHLRRLYNWYVFRGDWWMKFFFSQEGKRRKFLWKRSGLSEITVIFEVRGLDALGTQDWHYQSCCFWEVLVEHLEDRWEETRLPKDW